MKNAPEKVREYLIEEFSSLLKNPFFEEWVDSHAGYGSPPATAFILAQLEDFINLENENW